MSGPLTIDLWAVSSSIPRMGPFSFSRIRRPEDHGVFISEGCLTLSLKQSYRAAWLGGKKRIDPDPPLN